MKVMIIKKNFKSSYKKWLKVKIQKIARSGSTFLHLKDFLKLIEEQH